jgi:hypothetical protein
MTQTTETVIDRYITIFDRATHDPAALEELRSIFAPDATVQLADEQEPMTGLAAIMKGPPAVSGATELLASAHGSPMIGGTGT